MCCNHTYSLQRCQPANWCISLIVIDSKCLGEILGYNSWFVPQSTLIIEFSNMCPVASNYICVRSVGCIYASDPWHKSNIFQSLFNLFKLLSKHQNHSKIFFLNFLYFYWRLFECHSFSILHTVQRFVLLLPPRDLIPSWGSAHQLIGSAWQVGCPLTQVLKRWVNRYMRVKQNSRMASLLSVFSHWGGEPRCHCTI